MRPVVGSLMSERTRGSLNTPRVPGLRLRHAPERQKVEATLVIPAGAAATIRDDAGGSLSAVVLALPIDRRSRAAPVMPSNAGADITPAERGSHWPLRASATYTSGVSSSVAGSRQNEANRARDRKVRSGFQRTPMRYGDLERRAGSTIRSDALGFDKHVEGRPYQRNGLKT